MREEEEEEGEGLERVKRVKEREVALVLDFGVCCGVAYIAEMKRVETERF